MNGNIDLISASAGSGKTYRLANEIIKAIDQGVAPQQIVATTFTNKAAGELVQRIRSFLLKNGKWHEAQQIINGYVGTVNSICGRFLKDFCFEAGLPPVLEVIPEEDQGKVFERAVGPVIAEYAPKIEPIARKLDQEQWQATVKEIIDKARTNNIFPEDLRAHAEQAWQGLKRVLPMPFPETKEDGLDAALYESVNAALDCINIDDTTKATREFKTNIRKVQQRTSSAKDLAWSEWLRLIKKRPGAKSRAAWTPIEEAASVHPNHPRFHRDLESFISLIFECAAKAMQRFSDVKKREGWIDFVDQEALLLDLLESKTFSDLLSERVSRLFVDEFQDTSPIQLALFVKLASFVDGTIWVGDQKQSIYGFRGTDPIYMDEVIAQLIESSRLDILGDNYRSQPELVAFTNAIFESAFARQGFQKKTVRLNPKVEVIDAEASRLGVWRFVAANKADDARALAAGIKHLLNNCDAYPVLDKISREIRPLVASDIAVLCRLNQQCTDTADSLEELGIRASVPRTGLLEQAEAVLSVASLRCMIDPKDTLAKAEVVHYTTHESGTPQWFKSAVSQSVEILDTYPVIQELIENRRKMMHLSPSEAINLAIGISKVDQQALKWGKLDRRLANLDALRGFAASYEDHCRASKSAGTPFGLVQYLYNLAEEKKDLQASGADEKSVQVLTYHRAKGLEWPVVILTELNARSKAGAFGISVENPTQAFDPLNPLAGRWIRYWPWPYGGYSSDFGWDESLKQCEELKFEQDKEIRERLRLLYVGMTRARDYLILTLRENGKTDWMDELIDEDGNKIVSLPGNDEEMITVAGKQFSASVKLFEPEENEASVVEETVYRAKRPETLPDYPAARFSPSEAALQEFEIETRIISIGDRLPLSGSPEMDALGNAVHRFLAADRLGSTKEIRREMAASILRNWGVDEFSQDSLITASDRLRAFIEEQFEGSCKWYSEWPVHLKRGVQKATGWIDLLIETQEGYVIIDHKAFPGGCDTFEKVAEAYSSQLFIYKQAVEKSTGRMVKHCFLHLPLSGTVIDVGFKD